MSTITIGVDLAKLVFSSCEVDPRGRVRQRKDFRRHAFAQWLAQIPADTTVAMEACSGAHHWARRCQTYGLQPKLMAAQFVAPFRKSRATKNDRNDAEAIATAARQGNMRFVPIKTEAQQARLAWHRVREGYKAECLAASNRLRGLLAEFGVAMARSDPVLLRALAEPDVRAGLPAVLIELLDQHAAHWRQLRERLAECDRHITAQARADARCVRLQQLTGIGPLTADALVATVGNAREFKNGRQLAAWLGLVPSQSSSGGKTLLGGNQLQRRPLPAHTAGPGRTQQPAARPGGGARSRNSGAIVDPRPGRTPALRQGGGGHRQQARPAAVGDAGARRGLRPACVAQAPDGAAATQQAFVAK